MWVEILILIFIILIAITIVSVLDLRIVRGGNNPYIKEYGRWLAVQDMIRIFPTYEGTNILERWIVACANTTLGDDPILKINDIADSELLRECAEKKIRDADNKLIQLQQIRTRFLSGGYARYIPDRQPVIAGTEIKFGKFRVAVPEIRLTKMRELTGGDETPIILCALRYGSLIQRGQQWSAPIQVYKSMPENTVEGFASPFNSQNMMLGRKFCSLFPDTDTIFGSIGPFFDAKFPSDSSLGVNPPFVPMILARAAKRCIELDRPLFFIGPDWSGAEFQRELGSLKSELLTPGTYSYQDTLGKVITAKFPTRVYSKNMDVEKIVGVWRSIH